MNTAEALQEIKRSFRLYMNGPAAQSMRQKGLNYKLIWGVSLTDLKEIAKEYAPNAELAQALFQEPIRECKILSILLMPIKDLQEHTAEVWMNQIETQELAEIFVLHLLQHEPYANTLAWRWMESNRPLTLLCSFNLVGRLFTQGVRPTEMQCESFIHTAQQALLANDISLQHTVANAILSLYEADEKFAETMRRHFPQIVEW